MAFLQKAIDATGTPPAPLGKIYLGVVLMFWCLNLNEKLQPALASGEAVAAKPSKIVAGHDPENTNLWLQSMANLLANKTSTAAAVAKLTGKAAPKEPKKSKSKADEPPAKAGKEPAAAPSSRTGSATKEAPPAATATAAPASRSGSATKSAKPSSSCGRVLVHSSLFADVFPPSIC